VERGERIPSRSVDEMACPESVEMWNRFVADGVVVPVASTGV
jgi:hypothetical protein